MKIRCQHGYFLFEEMKVGKISKFMSLFGFDLVPVLGGGYTFSELEDAPTHSIAGNLYLNALAIETFEGTPWEIFRANGLIFNFGLGLVMPLLTVLTPVDISTTSNYFISNGLLLPGAIRTDGKRVIDYSCWYSFESGSFRYSEVNFESL